MSIPQHVTDDIADHMDAIASHFKNPKVTLVVRAPDLGDGDLIMTADILADAIAAIDRLRMRAPGAAALWPKRRALEDAPEDEALLLETTGGHVDTAICLINEDTGEREWFWHTDTPIHPNLKPLGWWPLPSAAPETP